MSQATFRFEYISRFVLFVQKTLKHLISEKTNFRFFQDFTVVSPLNLIKHKEYLLYFMGNKYLVAITKKFKFINIQHGVRQFVVCTYILMR